MLISKKQLLIIAIFCFLLLAEQQFGWASLGETTGQVGKSAVSTAGDLVSLPVDLVKTVGYSLKLVGEVIIFPFTLIS